MEDDGYGQRWDGVGRFWVCGVGCYACGAGCFGGGVVSWGLYAGGGREEGKKGGLTFGESRLQRDGAGEQDGEDADGQEGEAEGAGEVVF